MRNTLPAAFPFSRARRNGRRGFTLIEIMVVVGIIVILAAIGIAVGVQVKRSARERVTKTTLQTLDSAMGKYLHDGNAEPPIDPTFAANPASGNDPSNWQPLLMATEATILSSLPRDAAGKIVDGYGKPIQYIPSGYKYDRIAKTFGPSPGELGHFFSFGADGVSDFTHSATDQPDDVASIGAQ